MNNWYFIYNSSGFNKKEIKELSSTLEKLGYKYNQCTELGAGPSIEQVIAWIYNNQFASGVSAGILANYFYDLLKSMYLWFKSHKQKNKKIPTIELLLKFNDLEDKDIIAKLNFRIDKKYSKKILSELIKTQLKYKT